MWPGELRTPAVLLQFLNNQLLQKLLLMYQNRGIFLVEMWEISLNLKSKRNNCEKMWSNCLLTSIWSTSGDNDLAVAWFLGTILRQNLLHTVLFGNFLNFYLSLLIFQRIFLRDRTIKLHSYILVNAEGKIERTVELISNKIPHSVDEFIFFWIIIFFQGKGALQNYAVLRFCMNVWKLWSWRGKMY